MKGRRELNLKAAQRRSRQQKPVPFVLPVISGGLAALVLSPFVAYGFSLQYFAAAFDAEDWRLEADFFFRLSGVVLGLGFGALMMALGFSVAVDCRKKTMRSRRRFSFGRLFECVFALLLIGFGLWFLQVSIDAWGTATGIIREALDS
ncbi:hypothetical protein [Roseobacter sp.]|uniref:hypothetical protein n=1 Tax=Roseobacter sp. TaxID=1907202 RepID=UPI003297BDDA